MLVAVKSAGQLVVDHVPDENALSDAGRGHEAAVGRPAAPVNFVLVAFERFKHVAVVAQVPHLRRKKTGRRLEVDSWRVPHP